MAQMAAGESRTTTDHDEIQRWIEERGGEPARVKDTGGGDDPGILRIEFEGDGADDALKPISWDEWFDAFDENRLAFLHQEQTKDGGESRFSKLVSRDSDGN